MSAAIRKDIVNVSESLFVARPVNSIVRCGIWDEQVIYICASRHLCRLEGADVFLTSFCKRPCCAVCSDRGTEDKARHAGLTFPLSQAFVPIARQEGDHVIRCVVVCIFSFL